MAADIRKHQPHKKMCEKTLLLSIRARKIGAAQDISTNNFPKTHVTLWYRPGSPRLPHCHASTLAKLQINSTEELDKDSPNYHIAVLSTI